jgi:hypothetical protein
MNERIYQGIIGVLLFIIGGTFYYNTNKNDEKHVVYSTVKKPMYEAVDVHKLYANQRKENQLKKVKLNATLSNLQASSRRSMEMINNYNNQNPNNQLRANVDLSNLDNKAYNFDTPQVNNMNIDEIQQRVKELNTKIQQTQNTNAKSSIKSTSDNSIAQSSSGGSYSGSINSGPSSTTASDVTSTPSSSETTQNNNSTSNSSDTTVQNSQIIAYQKSINDISKVIEQINTNLN